jgi:UDP-hydrolysing UDP-N-acetyl-D-glucosamine 2-epimerase
MAARKICVVTGSRAEYGHLFWVMKEIEAGADLELQIIATGMHLSPEFGLTYRAIEADGFKINAAVEMLLSSDTAVGITKSVGVGIMGFADALQRIQPDLLVLLGDRFEIFGAALAATIARIPIAHIGGGDTTEGAFDESFRHCITKMSHLHFVTNASAANRVRQLGEQPGCIFNVGSPALDQIRRLKLLTREELEREIGFTLRDRNVLVTFHPTTLNTRPPANQFRELLNALESLGERVGLLFTKPNADTDGRQLIEMTDQFVAERANRKAFTSLGQLRYLSLVQHVDAVVGNSSSGIYEVPSFRKPTVNIGDRQRGRLRAASVLDCEVDSAAILRMVKRAFELDCSKAVNPFGDGHSAERIVQQLKEVADFPRLLQKSFFDFHPGT